MKTVITKKILIEMGTALTLILGAFACGVKGPPLPPVADTPDASDRASVSGSASPSPTPSPSPSPTPRPKRKKTH